MVSELKLISHFYFRSPAMPSLREPANQISPSTKAPLFAVASHHSPLRLNQLYNSKPQAASASPRSAPLLTSSSSSCSCTSIIYPWTLNCGGVNWKCVIILFAHYCSFYAVAAGWSSTASYTSRVTTCPIYIHPTSVAARLCPHTSSCAHVMQQIMIMVISTHFWRHHLAAIGIHHHLTH